MCVSYSILNFFFKKTLSKLYNYLNVEEQGAWIFDGALDLSQKGDCFSAVNKTMVVGQGDVHHWSNNNLKAKI